VITEHSEGCWQSITQRAVSRWVNHRAAVVVAVSDTVRRRLIAEGRAPAGRVVTIPNGVTPAPRHHRAERRDGHLVGVVSRLEPEKGVDVFLDAAAEVVRAVPTCCLLVVGDGSQRERLEARAARLGLEHRVQFLGWRTDAREIIGTLDLLAVPSRSEGLPLATLEAMSAGVPVVGSMAGGIPDLLDQGRTGLLAPVDDPRALASACIALLRDPARARQLGEAGRRRAASYFGHARMVAAIEEVYISARRCGRYPCSRRSTGIRRRGLSGR
jgi:glycosyltransferase involved in cell wall biosynthesis